MERQLAGRLDDGVLIQFSTIVDSKVVSVRTIIEILCDFGIQR